MTESNEQTTEVVVHDETPINGSLVAETGNSNIQQLEMYWKIAEKAYQSGLTKTTNQYDAFFIIGYGQELGISPFASLRTIYSVNGVPTCSGEMMLGLIRRSGLLTNSKIEELTDKQNVYLGAKCTMTRKDTGEELSISFTLDDATTAGLRNKQVWKSYPKNMCRWRAVSNVAKLLFGDVIGGLYTFEEIANDNQKIDESGAPIGDIIQGEITTQKVEQSIVEDIKTLQPKDDPPVTDAPQKEDVRKELVGKELNIVSIKSPLGQTVGREIYWEAFADYDEVPGNVPIRLYAEHFEFIAGLMTLTVPSLKNRLAHGELAIGDDNIVIIPQWSETVKGYNGLKMKSAFIDELPDSKIQPQADHKLSSNEQHITRSTTTKLSGDFWTQIYGDADIQKLYGHVEAIKNTINKHFPIPGEAHSKGYTDMKAWLIKHKDEKATT